MKVWRVSNLQAISALVLNEPQQLGVESAAVQMSQAEQLWLSAQSPVTCCSTLPLFVPDKGDWVCSGFKNFLMVWVFWLSLVWSLCWKMCNSRQNRKSAVVGQWGICIHEWLCWYGTAYGIWLRVPALPICIDLKLALSLRCWYL